MFPIRLRDWIFRLILWEVRIPLMVPRFYNVRSLLGSGRAIGARAKYRGLRTGQYTYVRSLNGPWLLYDNEADPFQLNNLVDDPEYADLCSELDVWLQRRLDARGDEFLPGADYIRQWGYTVNESGTVPYKKIKPANQRINKAVIAAWF